MPEDQQIIIYQTDDGDTQIEVLQDQSIWLTQKQMAEIFDKDSDTIGLHLKNIYKTQELSKEATTEEYSVVRQEGTRKVKRGLLHYNLDAIISVGYRVNSKKGTQFRIWANRILKDYLIKGYALNEKKLREKTQQLQELKRLVEIQGTVIAKNTLANDEASGLIQVINRYSCALDLLDDYDHQRLSLPKANSSAAHVHKITYDEARVAIDELGRQTHFEGLFGIEKDESFKSSLENIYQTFAGNDLYPTTVEKAAQLLYFVVKNHSFTDGNKRIAAFIFVWFLEKNQLLFNKKTGEKIINDNALVALTLMLASSKADDKDMMIKLTVNLLQ